MGRMAYIAHVATSDGGKHCCGARMAFMAVNVRIPAVMRTNTAGQAVIECTGTTVGAVLDDLSAQYPSIADVLFNEEKALHKYVNIYLDSDDIRYIGGLSAEVSNGAELTILPAVAGG